MPCQTIYTINALTLLLAHDEPAYADVLERADMTLADGIGAVWAVRRLTGRAPQRVAGVDLIGEMCGLCLGEGQSVYLLGGRPGVAQRAAQRLQAQYPGLQIAGVRDGFWEAAGEVDIIQEINRTEADLLLVGLGQPRQEIFLDRYRDRLVARLAIGVGGSFDVLAGDLRRAPHWLRRLGLEWFFRFLQEPWRWRRICQLPRFVWLVLRTKKGRELKAETRE
jgi:N-acetylglucosaminyldiphosphoundecaprenol N-acetyl-beta-D-mannosaminyltransferase